MVKIIGGKRYDTGTAQEVGYSCANCSTRDFSFWSEALYRKRTGEFFLYGQGGPMSKYRKYSSENSWGGGAEIIPLSVKEAMEWAEENLNVSEYEEIFGEVKETAEKRIVTLSLPLDVVEKIKRGAAENKVTMSEYIEILVRG